MARIKKFAPEQKLSSFQTFLVDENPNSDYFRITEFKDTFTGGKNGFLIEGSEYLKESTEIKIEILDVAGNPVYYEPGNGIPEYYEGISKLVAVYIYEDTPIGLGKITILGELKQYEDNGVIREIPQEWQGAYNVKWERTFQINKNLVNEDKVRFYRRPKVNIDEIVKPIFSGNPPSVTQIGSVDGIPLVPNENTILTNFSLPTSYRLRVNSGNKWTGSIEGQTIAFDNITYSPIIDEVVNETEIIVSPPYTENNLVKSFTNQTYSVTFPYIEGVGDLATSLTGSFAKISITDMKTFVGDAARVKVFRRSQSNLTDYEFVQEIQLESNELLRDIETFNKNEELYGQFTQQILDEYWVTSSNDIISEFNQNFLYNSVKLNSSPTNFFFTSQSFNIQQGVEYTLNYNVRKSSNVSGDYLKVFLSGSYNGTAVSQTISNISSQNTYLQKTNITSNIIADNFDTAKLYFEVSGSDWYVNNVSLKASQETSFSPDEITFIQQVPKTLVEETFDYRFEFYDINNNYIPIRVEETKTFTGGNLNLFEKSIEITPNNLYFSFDSASNPANAIPPTIINFDVDTRVVTGSITYTSGAFDFFGNLIPEASYSAGGYPGYLDNLDIRGGREPFLTVQNFTGSREDIIVQFIRFTGEVEGVSDSVVITRVEDGKGGVSFEIVPFRGTQIKNKESKTLEVQAVRVDGINRIDLRSGLTRGFSDAKLHLLSSSLVGGNEVTTYVSLSQAITNPNFIEGVSVGLTGSGEIDYNAIFTRDAIDNELTLYLMDGPTSESILTSLILTDLKDGLNNGVVTSTTDQFNIKYEPRKLSPFAPQQSIVTASFQRRGTTLNPLSASLIIYPSSSIEPKTELPHFYMFYETGAFDSTITLAVTDYLGNPINSGIPGNSVPYYEAVETKQLNLEFTYTEPITSASVTANKSFFITPDGLPGQNAIIIDIEPQPVALGSNHKGDVYNYELANTNIHITQGDLFLINTASGDPGTFTTRSITPTNIQFTTLEGDSSTTMSLGGFVSMSALSASIQYDFDIYPYFTASLVTASRTQTFTKVVEGGGAIEVTLDPIAVAFNADESGFISNYSLASTEVFIKQNDEFLLYDPSDSGTPGTFLTASISASGITFSEVSASNRDLGVSGSGNEILHFKGFGGIERTQPSASITYNFKVYPYSLDGGVAGVPRIVSKTQTFSKVNDGTKARKVSLRASANTIVYDGDGTKVAPAGDVVLTATAFNTTGSAYFRFLNDDDSVLQAASTNNIVTLSTLPGPGTGSSFRVELLDGNPTALVFDNDSVTISGVQEGTTPYSVVLSNNASSVMVEVDGTTYFDNSGTLIRAYKGATELQFVEFYDTEAVDPITFLPIGTFGQFSASIFEISTFLTHGDGRIVSQSGELFGSSSGISNWNSPQTNTQGFITYKIDFENGRGTQFVQQTFSTVFEGATGPGIVVRGEWTGSIDYVYTGDRRDVVIIRSGSSDVHYFATTDTLVRSGSQPFTTAPSYSLSPLVEEGDLVQGNWQYLGQQDFFVAAKMAIFEESFVENTINVGIPQIGDGINANIAIVGGTDEPYIAIGQNGTQGYAQPGVFLGLTRDGGPLGNAGTHGLLSLTSVPSGGEYNSLEWNGETLTIRGAIRQTSAGVIEPSLRGTWIDGTEYYPQDLVQYLGETWSSNTQHTSDISGDVTDGPPGTGPWTIAAGAGKGVTLLADSYVIAYDAAGSNPTPSGTMTLIASSSNFVNGYFKFTGGGAVFTDETSFTDGLSANTDTSTFTIPSSYFSTPLTFKVAVSEGNQTEVTSDTITITAVQPGADSTPMYVITPVAGGTQIKNGAGNIELKAQKIDSTGITDLSSGTIKIYSGSTEITSISGVTGTDYNPTIPASAIFGTMYLRLWDTSTIYDTITLLDVTDGLGGGTFLSPNLKSTRNPSTNTFTPSFLSATASFFDTSGTEYQRRVQITPSFSGGVDRMAVSAASGDTEITITATDGDGGVITLGGSSVPTKDTVLTAVFTDPATNQQSTITETFYIISDGLDGIDALTVVLTNESHTFAASSDGTVASYAGSGTEIYLYEGTSSILYDGVGTSNGTFNVSATPTNITVGSISDGGSYAIVANHSNMTEDSASIVYTLTGKRFNGDSISLTKTQSLVKARAGEPGPSGSNGIDGQDGTGAGVVYRGNWDVNEVYYHTSARRDVVLDSNGNYWLTNDPDSNGEQGGVWGNPAIDNTLWESFGAEFSSVATDILFAQDVYANRTVNIGASGGSPVIALNADSSSGYLNPRIQIGQDIVGGDGFGDNGIYIGYAGGSPVLSFVTESAGRRSFFIYESGSITLSDANFTGTGSAIIGPSLKIGRNTEYSITSSLAYNMSVASTGFLFAQDADIRGTINALDGQIGDWQITETQITSVNQNIVLDADEESITVFDTNGDVKFVANTDTSLPSIQAGDTITVTAPSTTFTTSSTDGSGFHGATSDLALNVSGWGTTFQVGSSGRWVGSFNYTDTYTRAYAEGIATAALTVRLIITSGSNVVAFGNSFSMGATGDAVYTGGSGGMYSVLPNTEITLSDGTTKYAKDITTKDKILAWDEVNQSFVEAHIGKIDTTIKNYYKRIHLEDRIVEVTHNHCFWYDGGVEVSALELNENDFIYCKSENTIVKNKILKVEDIADTTEVFTFTIPTYQNYITNGLLSHNAVGDYYTTSENDVLPSSTFNISANLLSSTNYQIKFRRVYSVSSFNPSSPPWEDGTLTFSGQVYARMGVSNTTFTVSLLSAGTYINGGGFQSVTSGVSTEEKYIRHRTTAINSTGNYFTDVVGGLAVDALFGTDNIGLHGGGGGAYNVPGYPYIIKGGAIITFTSSATGTHGAGTVQMSAGCFTSVSGTTTTQGVYDINFTSETGDGTDTSGKYIAIIASGQRTNSGDLGKVAAMGVEDDLPTTGTGTIRIFVHKPNSDILENLQNLQLIFIQ